MLKGLLIDKETKKNIKRLVDLFERVEVLLKTSEIKITIEPKGKKHES